MTDGGRRDPSKPEPHYAVRRWQDLDNWLRPKPQYRPFVEAQAFVRTLGIESSRDWVAYCQTGEKPEDIPTTPQSTYFFQGWNGYADWLRPENTASPSNPEAEEE